MPETTITVRHFSMLVLSSWVRYQSQSLLTYPMSQPELQSQRLSSIISSKALFVPFAAAVGVRSIGSIGPVRMNAAVPPFPCVMNRCLLTKPSPSPRDA